MPETKEWHEDESNTAHVVNDSPDENIGEELNVDEYGEEVSD